MKLVAVLISLFIINTSFSACDKKFATRAAGGLDELYDTYRYYLAKVSSYRDELFYERKSVTTIYSSSESFAKAIQVHGFTIELLASSAKRFMEDCFYKVEKFNKFANEFERESKNLSKILENNYLQCQNSGDKSFRAKIERAYKKRDSYKTYLQHFRDRKVAGLKKACQNEYDFVVKAIELGEICNKRKASKAMREFDEMTESNKKRLGEMKKYYKENYIDANPYHKYFKSIDGIVSYLKKYGKAADLAIQSTLIAAKQCLIDAEEGSEEFEPSIAGAREIKKIIDSNYKSCQDVDPSFSSKLRPYFEKSELLIKSTNELKTDWYEKLEVLCKREIDFLTKAIKEKDSCTDLK